MYISKELEKNFSSEVLKMLDKYTKEDTGEPKVDISNMTENENAIYILFAKWSDLEETFNYISYCKVYINSFKYYPKIPKSNHLHFIYESYLNHIYSLKVKMEAFIISITRVLKKQEKDSIVINTINSMKNITKIYNEYFENDIKVRGRDVHVQKYFPSDIHVTNGFEYIIETSLKTPQYQKFLKNELSNLKKKYRVIFISTEKAIKKILISYFSLLNTLLFKEKYIKKVSSKSNKISDRRD